mgnify:CR=1 FL=1
MFVGNTFVKKEDVMSKYRVLPEYYVKLIDQIESDIRTILGIIKNYELSEAIDELEILAEKLY